MTDTTPTTVYAVQPPTRLTSKFQVISRAAADLEQSIMDLAREFNEQIHFHAYAKPVVGPMPHLLLECSESFSLKVESLPGVERVGKIPPGVETFRRTGQKPAQPKGPGLPDISLI